VLTYPQSSEVFETFGDCYGTLVSDVVVVWVTPLLIYPQLSEFFKAFSDCDGAQVSSPVVG
jgi:hypothetical protein